MRLPAIKGLIERRLLVNYRVDPQAIRRVLPAPFRPQLVGDWAVAGICLIRLSEVRPIGVPRWLGIRSENAAHRIAVEWDDRGERHVGVYIPRRDTSSRFNTFVGGRFFPGEHHPARFFVHENNGKYDIEMKSVDGRASVEVHAKPAAALPRGSAFASLAEASAFFRRGALGYSATSSAGRFDGLELDCHEWEVRSLEVDSVRSSFFEDKEVFRPGEVEFDNALVMTNVQHQWLGRATLCCEVDAQPLATTATTLISK